MSTLPLQGRQRSLPGTSDRHWRRLGGKSNTWAAASSPSTPVPKPQGPPNDPRAACPVLPAAAPPTQASAALKGQLSMTRSTIFCSSLLGGQGIPPKVAGSHTRGCRLSPTRCCSRRLYCSGGGGGAGSPGPEGGEAAMMSLHTHGRRAPRPDPLEPRGGGAREL